MPDESPLYNRKKAHDNLAKVKEHQKWSLFSLISIIMCDHSCAVKPPSAQSMKAVEKYKKSNG